MIQPAILNVIGTVWLRSFLKHNGISWHDPFIWSRRPFFGLNWSSWVQMALQQNELLPCNYWKVDSVDLYFKKICLVNSLEIRWWPSKVGTYISLLASGLQTITCFINAVKTWHVILPDDLFPLSLSLFNVGFISFVFIYCGDVLIVTIFLRNDSGFLLCLTNMPSLRETGSLEQVKLWRTLLTSPRDDSLLHELLQG